MGYMVETSTNPNVVSLFISISQNECFTRTENYDRQHSKLVMDRLTLTWAMVHNVLADILTLLIDIVTPSVDIVTPLADIVALWAEIMTLLLNIVSSAAYIVTPLVDIVTLLADIVTLLADIVNLLADIVTPLADPMYKLTLALGGVRDEEVVWAVTICFEINKVAIPQTALC